jgi:hypothetical protein
VTAKRKALALAVAAAVHESAHCVAAIRQGLLVPEAIAAPGRCEVTTRWRRPRTVRQALDVLEALAIVDLAGPQAEEFYLGEKRRDAEWRADEQNAASRCRAIVRLSHDLAEDAELTPALCVEVDAVFADLLDRAQALIRESESGRAIKKIAVALAAGKSLGQDRLEALIEGS